MFWRESIVLEQQEAKLRSRLLSRKPIRFSLAGQVQPDKGMHNMDEGKGGGDKGG